MYQRLYKNLTKQLIHRHQMFHVSTMFFIEQKPRIKQALHNIGFDEVFKYKNKDGEEQT